MDGFVSAVLKILAFLLSLIMAVIGFFRGGTNPEDPTVTATATSAVVTAKPDDPSVPQPTGTEDDTGEGTTVTEVSKTTSSFSVDLKDNGISIICTTETYYSQGAEIKKVFSARYTSGGRTYGNSVTFIKNSSGGYNLQSDSTINTILTTTNGYRAEVGVTALKLDYKDTCAAMFRAAAMAACCDMDHNTPGASFSDAINLFDISFNTAAENIAYQKNLSDESVCEGWKNSSGHYSNIIDGRLALTGIGYAVGSDGATYYAQVFTG
ncbi:MAG: hypothetical protein J5562_08555 [Clostridia bacterium]|nr:hypothetical protein [Clostridia bacterium]